jgi:penicillin-binding protein 2
MSLEGQAEREPSSSFWRTSFLQLVVIVVFGIIALRLYAVQIRQGPDFREKSRHNFFQFKRLEHARGEILDREGRTLVTNRPSVNVYVTPAFFPSTRKLVVDLGRAVGLDKKAAHQLADALSKAVVERGPALLLARDLGRAEAEALREAQERAELPLEAVPMLRVPGSSERFAAYLDPDHFPTVGLVLRRLQEALQLTEEDLAGLRRRIGRATGLERYVELVVRRDVPPEVEGRLALWVQLGELPGVSVRRATARHYPHEQLAAHLLGYVNELTPAELEERAELGYRIGDQIGRRGVEQSFEEELRGVDGRETVVVDSKGRSQGSSFAEELQREVGEREPPRPGDRVTLTIDYDLQAAAEAAFDGQAGAVVAMETATGRLLALTSTPSFNPNKLVGYFDPAEKRRLDALNEQRPWRFRAIQDHFAPGSTFKVVTAIAALETQVTHGHETTFCSGAFRLGNTRFRCWKDEGHGSVDLEASVAKSCDVFYYTMGTRMGLDPIAEWARALGFGHATGVELRSESAGIMPDRAWYKKRGGYTLGAAVNASIGQGAVSVTPLQLAVAYAAIANGGTVFEPQVVLRVESYDGERVREQPPLAKRTLTVKPETLLRVREGLREVVNEPFGTAYKRRLPELAVAGKTGTAQVAKLGKKRLKPEEVPWKLRDHAWFAAFAPAEAPELVVVVLHQHGGGGSSAAAPIAMKVFAAWHAKKMRLLGKSPSGEPLTVVTAEDLVEEEGGEVETASTATAGLGASALSPGAAPPTSTVSPEGAR